MPKFTGLNHLAFATGDMDKTLYFWRDLLGMRLVAGFGRPGYRQYFLALSEHELIAFFEWPGVERVPYKRHGEPVTGPFIFDHVSFGVETEEELWELADKLTAADFPASDLIDHGFIHSIYSYDPNGIPLEFSHNVEGVDIRKKPMMADSEPCAAALEGPEARPGRWPEVDEPIPEDEKMIVPGEGSGMFDEPAGG